MMSDDLEDKLLEILTDLDKEISFEYDSNLYYKAIEKASNATSEEKTDKAKRIMLNIFLKFVVKNRDYTGELWEGIATITNNNLNILEKNFKEILENIDAVRGGFQMR